MTIGPLTLVRVLKSRVVSATDLVRQLQNSELERSFRELVRRLLPDQAEAIITRRRDGPNHEADRIYDFCAAFERKYFPIMEFEEMEQLTWGPPFQRMGWDYDEMHDVDRFKSEFQMLLTLVANPYDDMTGIRTVLKEELEPTLGKDLLRRLGPALEPLTLHLRLDDGPYKALAEFADWVWGDTGSIFLDATYDSEVGDLGWEDETIATLTEHWRIAEGILQRIDTLTDWLAVNPRKHFALLVAAAAIPHPSEKDLPDQYRTTVADDGRLIHVFGKDPELNDQDEDTPPTDSADQRLALPTGAAV